MEITHLVAVCQDPHQSVLCGEPCSAVGGSAGPRDPGLGLLECMSQCCRPQASLLLILASWAQEVGRETVPDLRVQQTRTLVLATLLPHWAYSCCHCSMPQFPYVEKGGQ